MGNQVGNQAGNQAGRARGLWTAALYLSVAAVSGVRLASWLGLGYLARGVAQAYGPRQFLVTALVILVMGVCLDGAVRAWRSGTTGSAGRLAAVCAVALALYARPHTCPCTTRAFLTSEPLPGPGRDTAVLLAAAASAAALLTGAAVWRARRAAPPGGTVPGPGGTDEWS